jgi:hypothetical protein
MPLFDASDADMEADIIIQGMKGRRSPQPHSPISKAHHRKKLGGKKKGAHSKADLSEEDETSNEKSIASVNAASTTNAATDPDDERSTRLSKKKIAGGRAKLQDEEEKEVEPASAESGGWLYRLFGWGSRAPPVKVHRRIPDKAAAAALDLKDSGLSSIFDRNFDWTACRCKKRCPSGLGSCPQQYPGLPDRSAPSSARAPLVPRDDTQNILHPQLPTDAGVPAAS